MQVAEIFYLNQKAPQWQKCKGVGGGGGENQETRALVLTIPLMLSYVQQGQNSLLYLKTSQLILRNKDNGMEDAKVPSHPHNASET